MCRRGSNSRCDNFLEVGAVTDLAEHGRLDSLCPQREGCQKKRKNALERFCETLESVCSSTCGTFEKGKRMELKTGGPVNTSVLRAPGRNYRATHLTCFHKD